VFVCNQNVKSSWFSFLFAFLYVFMYRLNYSHAIVIMALKNVARTNISEMQSKMDQEEKKWTVQMDFVNNALTDEKKQKEVTKALEM